MANVSIDDLESTLDSILEEYGDSVRENINEAVKRIAKTSIGTLKSTSPKSKGRPSFGKKHYADNWAVKEEITRLSVTDTIYNRDTYRLAHLLENGHAKRGGGRVPGRAHIKPVEDAAIRSLERAVS